MCWNASALANGDVTRLRHRLMDHLRAFGTDDADFGAAEVVLGELLANAGRYTPGEVCVEIGWDGPSARVSVHDAGPGFEWRASLPVDTGAETGRGLFIVEALATEIAVERSDDGCRISVTLPVTRRGAPASAPRCPGGRFANAPGVCSDPRRRLDCVSLR